MRRIGIVAAVLIVLVANAWVLVGVLRNRSGSPDAEIVLTEREMALPEWSAEDTGLFLRLVWSRGRLYAPDEMEWFDRAKLETVGFDASHPLDHPDADEHYSRMLAREAFVVFEYDGNAWRAWQDSGDEKTRQERAQSSRLFAMDVGVDAKDLRAHYPDRSRYLVVPATVDVSIVTPRKTEEDASTPTPTLRGRIRQLRVWQVSVPKEARGILDELRRKDHEARSREKPPAREDVPPPWPGVRVGEPRYKVVLRYGSRLEPWIVEVQPI